MQKQYRKQINIQKGAVVSNYIERDIDLAGKKFRNTIHVIGVVDAIKGKKLLCRHSICSVDGAEFVPTKQVCKGYTHERAEDIELCNTQEFDIVVDTGIIPRSILKNVGDIEG